MSWLDGLNQISPDYSPTNGMHDPSFEYSAPIDALELQRQLDEWTNVPFAIDPPVLKRADFENDEYMRRNKTATAQHSGLDFNLGLDLSAVDAGASPSSPTADRRTSSSGSNSVDIPSSVADSLHPLAFANVLALPHQREANRQARDARTHGLQSHASEIFSQPLAASFSMPMASTAADAGIPAGSDPFLSLLSLPGVSAPTAAPAALQQQRQHSDALSHTSSVQAPLSRAQQQAAAKNRGRSSHQVTATPGTTKASAGTAARRASTGIEALRENTSAKSGVGTKATAAPAAPKPVAESVPDVDDEELNKVAVEEDKRRRNTAASARFRIKKKQREQALEASASALRERVAELEKEVDTLKQENGWLRGLVVEKTNLGPGAAADETASKGRKRLREDDGEDDLVEA